VGRGAGKVWAKPAVLAPPEQGTPPNVCERYGIVADNCKATTYYHFGSQRVAMREQTDGNPTGAVYWLHSDHLGSASLTTDASGGKFAELRYKPWGEVRWSNEVMPTDRRFNGMMMHAGLGGLVTMGVREYLPTLGRWLSADTIVPRPGDPQAFNRFSYVRNSPLGRIDPTGHADCQTGGCPKDWKEKRIDWSLAIKFKKNGKVDILAYIAARYASLLKEAEAINASANSLPPGVSFGVRMAKFKDLTGPGMPADIKWEIQALARSQGDDVAGKQGQFLFEQDGKTYDADDIGNYGFGVLSAKAGISPGQAAAAGGIAQAIGDMGARLNALVSGGDWPNRTIGQTVDEWQAARANGVEIYAALDEAPDLVPVGTGIVNGDNPLALDRSQFARLTVDFFDLFR
jgi:RHS repeat-associated protein